MENKILELIQELNKLNLEKKVENINKIKTELKKISPFTKEPVDNVQWVKQEEVYANDYNPNSVAPKEMELLHTSIKEDGYTQPIVVWKTEKGYEVVDGFHRNRVGKECEDIKERINGYLPVVIINEEVEDRGQRMASTIRHNRARGQHKVDSMSDIVLELKKRNWSNEKISKKLGMDADEVLRLSQIGGLAEMFSDKEFSEAWEIVNEEKEELIDEASVL
jgi:ParB-like chromosome segregation protein Spo0J